MPYCQPMARSSLTHCPSVYAASPLSVLTNLKIHWTDFCKLYPMSLNCQGTQQQEEPTQIP